MVWSSALPAAQSSPLLQELSRLVGRNSGLVGSGGSAGLTDRRGKVGDGGLSERRGGLSERRGKLGAVGGVGGRGAGLSRRGLLANGPKMGDKMRGGRRSRRGGKQHSHKIALPLQSSSSSSHSHKPSPPTPKALSVQTFFNPSHIINSAPEPIQPSLNLSGIDDGSLTRRRPRPVFDEAAPREVSGLTGTAAYLHCLVHHLGNRSVSR
ncbi:hypothetical protein Pmani_039768 [Petrolisthes manimaculis]|uniref:Uncharacterized protein n=1 Tax=Petrolisthes manimaculis TaxID=1843537 RepID=A0AAE1NDB2_9EUCA|nr:hypothetical protein Pmani_039768 [Petrolisthes manimaculis]